MKKKISQNLNDLANHLSAINNNVNNNVDGKRYSVSQSQSISQVSKNSRQLPPSLLGKKLPPKPAKKK